MTAAQGKPKKFRAWVLAIRPKTLPAAASPVLVGAGLAFVDGGFDLEPALAALAGALLLQIGANVANDYYDYQKGADAGDRLGPTRVTQAGLLSPEQVRGGMVFVFGLCLLVGAYLVYHAGWWILAIGIAAILSALAYTAGPYPLGYHGWGDLFVFIFFGLAATAGSYYVQVGGVTPLVWCMSAAMGLLTVAILVVNNLRDMHTDRLAGKRTLAVRFGAAAARWEYALCLSAAYGIPVAAWGLGLLPAWGLLVVFSSPLAWRWARVVFTTSGRALNAALAGTGQLELVYALIFTLGLVLGKWA
jgi:1,4-dihydroxy-2-naphthoate octaprenyltransferase